jgi:HTH-type transcriptional repressor of NAD biosynthesis genes
MEETLRQTPSNCLKIVLFGPESTGKSTLARELAKRYETLWVPEYMREYAQEKWDDKGKVLDRNDLIPIAVGQMQSENKLAPAATKFLFCDTDLLELKVYSEFYFNGFCPSEVRKACLQNTYHHYFLTQIDIPWKQDDLRDRPYEREKLFRIFESELQTNKLPYTLLDGSLKERLHKATQVLKTLKLKPNAH